jgi:hypothetical protein
MLMAEGSRSGSPQHTTTRAHGLRSLVHADVLMRALRKFRILRWNPPGGLKFNVRKFR